jgi:2,5-furandicarboxylate decarboxylase 1
VDQPKDLRSFLRLYEREHEPVVRIDRAVSLDRELSAIVKLLESRGNPIVLFEDVNGSRMPVLVGLHGTRERIALALGSEPRRAVEDYLEHLHDPIAPVVEPTGPVKDVRMAGDDVDLNALPILVHAEKDSGPFITAAVGIAAHPETGAVNTGMYRLEVAGRNLLTVAAAGDLETIILRAEELGQPLEFVVALGHHPVVQIASQAKLPITADSLAATGALLREPLVMTPGETIEAHVPAYAEIVLEGHFLPRERKVDGPFGESPYYYETYESYVAEITAITHRSDAVYLDIHNVHSEHRLLALFPCREGRLLERLRSVFPNVREVHMPVGANGTYGYISLDKPEEGEAKSAMMIALGSGDRFLKHVVVVDSDVDIWNHEDVLWALGMRFQADRDMIVIPNAQGTLMNPVSYSLRDRSSHGTLTTQVGFDATQPIGITFPERADFVGDRFSGLNVDALLSESSAQGPPLWQRE